MYVCVCTWADLHIPVYVFHQAFCSSEFCCNDEGCGNNAVIKVCNLLINRPLKRHLLLYCQRK